MAEDVDPGPSVASQRIDTLATLPIFFKLRGRRVLLVGGGEPALWKAELLLAAGATLQIHAVSPCAGILELAITAAPGTVALTSRTWGHCDLLGVALAIGDFADDQDAARFASAVRATGVPVNVIDKPEFCDFQFGALVNRSPLVVAISTDGAAPVFGQAIRARIETVLPKGFTRWAEAAKSWRTTFQSSRPDFRARRRFWEQFAAIALSGPDRAPTDLDFTRCLAAATAQPIAGATIAPHPIAMLRTEPGASPSDAADRLTLRAVRLLGAADVVIHDERVPGTVIEFARREAIRVSFAGGQGDGAALAIEHARSGRHVVRIVHGDVDRLAREVDAITTAGVPSEILAVAISMQR